jgi:hypothetical protein
MRAPRFNSRRVVAGAFALALCGYLAPGAAAAQAPACLPASVQISAQLPGSHLDISPAPDSVTADPRTQLSFLGAPAGEIRVLSVSGSSSGSHPGALHAYSQGDGASFVPASPFTAGERVSVRVSVSGKTYSYRFHVDTPWSTAGTGGFPNPTARPSDYQTFYTLPGAQAPVLTVTKADGDPGAGDIFTSNGPGPGRYGAMIYTPAGRLVWINPLSGGETADDVRVQSYEGRRDLTFWQGKVLSLGYGQGEDKIVNSHYQTVATVKAGNGLYADLHDFELAPHDVAYITAYNPISCDLKAAQGPSDGVILDATVEEIDIKTGLVRWEWHALDHVNVNDSETSPGSRPWDWFHINSIDPEPNGDVFISSRNTWAGYQLQGGSGVILWTLGGENSSFKMGHGTQTYWQHDGRLLANGDVTFFDDGSSPNEEYQSRVVEISLDLANKTAHLVHAFDHPGVPLLAASQGNVETLANGDSFVGYGGVPEISEYSPSGALVYDAHFPYDQLFYRAYRYPWSATPASPPAVLASENNTGLETVVHMSWNGATGVAAWRVLAGSSASALRPRVSVAVSGFETETILNNAYRDVEVEALDSSGHVLASSRPAAVISFDASFERSA